MDHPLYNILKILSRKTKRYVSIMVNLQHKDYPHLYGAINIHAGKYHLEHIYIQCINIEYAPKADIKQCLRQNSPLYSFTPYIRTGRQSYCIRNGTHQYIYPNDEHSIQDIVKQTLNNFHQAEPVSWREHRYNTLSVNPRDCPRHNITIPLHPSHWIQGNDQAISKTQHLYTIHQNRGTFQYRVKKGKQPRHEITLEYDVMFPDPNKKQLTINPQLKLSDIVPQKVTSPPITWTGEYIHENLIPNLQHILQSPAPCIHTLMRINQLFPTPLIKWNHDTTNHDAYYITYLNHAIINTDILQKILNQQYYPVEEENTRDLERSGEIQKKESKLTLSNMPLFFMRAAIQYQQHPNKNKSELSQHAFIQSMRKLQHIIAPYTTTS